MADMAPLAGLLHQAGEVFNRAAHLGTTFQNKALEAQATGRLVDPIGWDHQQPACAAFYVAILDLRDAMQNPPDGFAPVAEALLEAARVAKKIRDAMETPEGRTWAAYLDFFPELNSVAAAGHRVTREVSRAQRISDSFAFLDQSATGQSASSGTSEVEAQDGINVERKASAPPTLAITEANGEDGESKTAESEEKRYDPCDREPRRFWELCEHAAYCARFARTKVSGVRAPAMPSGDAYRSVGMLCRNKYGAFDLDALAKLRDEYHVSTGKTVEQINDTPLREIANHFVPQRSGQQPASVGSATPSLPTSRAELLTWAKDRARQLRAKVTTSSIEEAARLASRSWEELAKATLASLPSGKSAKYARFGYGVAMGLDHDRELIGRVLELLDMAVKDAAGPPADGPGHGSAEPSAGSSGRLPQPAAGPLRTLSPNEAESLPAGLDESDRDRLLRLRGTVLNLPDRARRLEQCEHWLSDFRPGDNGDLRATLNIRSEVRQLVTELHTLSDELNRSVRWEDEDGTHRRYVAEFVGNRVDVVNLTTRAEGVDRHCAAILASAARERGILAPGAALTEMALQELAVKVRTDEPSPMPNATATAGAVPTADQSAGEMGAESGGVSRGDLETELRKMIAALGDDNAVRVYAIARDKSKSVDERQRALCALDRRFVGFTSDQWGNLLGATGSAARQTNWWKQDRARLIGSE
jgi:hypothetical protein